MRIETAGGHTILADDADFDLLWNYTWWASGSSGRLYACAHVPGSGTATKQRIKMHRLLMSPPAGLIVHHKNNNGLDNRRSNLQVTSQRVNTKYAGQETKGGIYQERGGWRVQTRDECSSPVYIGTFMTEEKARVALKNWNYNKMLQLEQSEDPLLRDFAKVLEERLTETV